jgi:class 3 adenylate cyclase/tRNA A-37 threonylcarbamoyl transferase component Bud32
MSDQQIGGKYHLERRLAGGGMGSIWVAYDSVLHRRVAVKRIASAHAGSQAAREQFKREALAVAQLQHPNVVSIHDYGIDGSSPYIVMELLEGEDLEVRIVRQGKLSPSALAFLLHQVAKALTAAHAAGIIHRDLKPANLFLARAGPDEVVKVLDFGLARIISSDVPVPGQPQELMGTPRYMSPEQMRRYSQLDHRADVWSLAVVAYRALTGQFPFSAETFNELLSKVTAGVHIPIARFTPELGNHFDTFFTQAFNPDPQKRFQSARELALQFSSLVETLGSKRPMKILVVDDEPEMERLMFLRFRKHIRNGAYEFVFAQDGEAALEQLRRHPDVAVVLSDINMPRMNGLTLLTRVGEVNPLLKVIIVSAYSDMSNIRVAMNRGAFDFLVKPIDMDDLETTVAKTLKHVTEIRQLLRSTEENSLLRTFVHGGVAERLLPMVRGAALPTTERVDATVVFVDVKGFTSVLSEQPAEAAVRRLNAHFEVVVPVLAAHGATVDKFLGDAVMAVFHGEGHLARALEACLAARQQLSARAEQTGDPIRPSHGLCIGMDSGEIVCGSVGSRTHGRFDYTVLGQVVNMAARLVAVADRDQLLITEALARRVESRFECVSVGPVQLAGEPVPRVLHNVIRSKHGTVSARDATVSIHRSADASE